MWCQNPKCKNLQFSCYQMPSHANYAKELNDVKINCCKKKLSTVCVWLLN